MPAPQRILFTAFEPSGDALAAAVIGELRRREPALEIFALGGPRMAAAGATLLEQATDRPTMFAESVAQFWSHRRRVRRLEQWLAEHPIAALVPTDSPAANWSICAAVRRIQPTARIVHLAAPQLWAWASWRIAKLRRLTDHVLCLLPFEPGWFTPRGVSATFVGHPVFDRSPSAPAPMERDIRLALLPGSRRSEVLRNWPTMLQVYRQLRVRHPRLRGRVAAAHEQAATLVRSLSPAHQWPKSLEMTVHDADDVLAWSHVVLVVSGTATLQVAAHRRPMVVLFNTGWWPWQLVGRWVIATRTFALPNLVVQPPGEKEPGQRIVPEFVPHFGQTDPVAAAVDRLVSDEGARREQLESLGAVAGHFTGRSFARDAAGKLLEVAGIV